MGFKTDTSFLRFLSMGAIGVRQTMAHLRTLGFKPIELERYCTSNKIWMTKVKRLRLPDVLCVRTGLRLEVRAKSDLKIRMSDAPANPDRRWDAGLRNDDVAAFIAISEDKHGVQRPADEPVFFTVRALRESVGVSKLGPPKSASEGAERDRTWPAVVPSRGGLVHFVDGDRLVVEMHGDDSPSRRQTYVLNGRHPYVRPGDTFEGNVSILAGAPAQVADLTTYHARTYDALADLRAADPVDRYAGVKALPHREDLQGQALAAIEGVLAREGDERVALEAAATAATLGSAMGQDRVAKTLQGDGRADLRMEAVLILTELSSPFARQELVSIATSRRFVGDEIRQAAVWGLGKAGLKAYEELLPFIADPDENVALHAIVAFGGDTPEPVIKSLVKELLNGDARRAPAASEALRLIGTDGVAHALAEAALAGDNWVVATLGRLSPGRVKTALAGSALMQQVAPFLLLSEGASWLASEDHVIDIAFLAKQNL